MQKHIYIVISQLFPPSCLPDVGNFLEDFSDWAASASASPKLGHLSLVLIFLFVISHPHILFSLLFLHIQLSRVCLSITLISHRPVILH